MNVRPVRTLEDVRAMEDVNRRAWRDAYDGILHADTLERLAEVATVRELRHRFDLLSEWTGESIVAEFEAESPDPAAPDGEIVGYAVVRWGDDVERYVTDGDAWLKEIYVDPTVWGEGAGTELLEHAAAAVPEDTDGLVASTLADNRAGRRFYEARGFEVIDEREETIDGETYPAVVYRLGL